MNNETEQNMIEKNTSRRKYIIAAICVVLFMIVALVVAALNNKSKPDPESEKIIREEAAKKLNKDPNELTDEDYAIFNSVSINAYGGPSPLDDLSFLDIPVYVLSDIKLLEKFTNLQTLEMYSININLGRTPEWKKILRKFGINITSGVVIDLTPLEGLTNLQMLYFNGTSIKNVKSLSNLINLKSLHIDNTYVTDLRPLKELKNLEMLTIRGCDGISDKQIKDLQKALPNLEIIK